MTADLRRHCSTLGLIPPVTAEQVKQAYRDLVMVWHPDRFPANDRLQKQAEERMREINAAYQALRYGIEASDSPGAENASYAAAPPRPTGTVYPSRFSINPLRLIPRWLPAAFLSAATVLGVISGAVWLIESADPIEVPGTHQILQTPFAANSIPVPETRTAPHRRREKSVEAPDEPRTGTELIATQGLRGIGVLNIANSTDLDAAVSLISTRPPRRVLRMAYLQAGSSIRITGIAPGEYMVDAQLGRQWLPASRTFASSPSHAVPIGPLFYIQIQSAGGVQGDEHSVNLTSQ